MRLLPLGYPNGHSRSAPALPPLPPRRLSHVSMASNHPTDSHAWWFMVSSLSCQLLLMVPWQKTFSVFPWVAFAWTIPAEHHCPNPEHLSPISFLLPWSWSLPSWNHWWVLLYWKYLPSCWVARGRSCRGREIRQCPIKPKCLETNGRNWGQCKAHFWSWVLYQNVQNLLYSTKLTVRWLS